MVNFKESANKISGSSTSGASDSTQVDTVDSSNENSTDSFDPSYGFKSNHDLIPLVLKFYENFKSGKYDSDNYQRVINTVDDAICVYLIIHGKFTVIHLYKILVFFLCEFRNYVNTRDWEFRRSEEGTPLSTKSACVDQQMKASEISSPEHIPDMINGFLEDFLPKFPHFDFGLILSLTENFCQWLYRQELTQRWIELVDSVSNGNGD
eukprot:CAMPEP_0114975760 /NCGR_PEP_ID=MMETSP0216-20121206/2287_1 /TAXON_ID=223996 /ORGANISM="Protocruzia adherens, Strain Boccale" /LENGTH=207 /DNA_ID=CAMNT_0002336595 /DNA_START=735 /DNA_END=1358 /DNA_ORIENTATION=+